MSIDNPLFINDGNGFYRCDVRISADDIVKKARQLAAHRLRRGSDALSSPQMVRDYLSLHLGNLEHEEFWGIFLDNRHRVITREKLASGTLDSAAVYPREVLKRTLACNAAAVIFAHNHPSGVAEPSDTDIRLTQRLIESLKLIDVRVLDHLIIGANVETSLAERGLL